MRAAIHVQCHPSFSGRKRNAADIARLASGARHGSRCEPSGANDMGKVTGNRWWVAGLLILPVQLFSAIFVPSVVKVLVCQSRNEKRFNTESTKTTEATEAAQRASLIHLCAPGDSGGGLRAAPGGLFGDGEHGDLIHRHIHGSDDSDLAL